MSQTSNRRAIVLFALPPEVDGRRKRLAPGVFVALTRRLEQACSELEAEGVDWWYADQAAGSLGPSLQAAFAGAFARGYRQVLVVGNDAPQLDRAYLQDAFDALEHHGQGAVLGPSRDGGYALLGLTAACPAAFDGIPWGTASVARLTAARVETAGFRLACLRPLDDIDDARGLSRLLTLGEASLDELVRLLRRLLAPAAPLATTPWSPEDRLLAWVAAGRAPPSPR